MITINLRLIAALPFYLLAALSAIWFLWCQVVGMIALFALDIPTIVVSEVFAIIASAIAAAMALLAQKIKGGTA